MGKLDGWELVRSGQYRAALGRFEHDREELRSDDYSEIAMAHLYFGNPEAAKKVLDRMINEPPGDSFTHALAGISRWMLGECREAALVWEKGLDCDYQDMAGGMALPLLLYYAAARKPKAYDISKAKRLVKNALQRPAAENWPGPIGVFLLGKLDSTELLRLADSEHRIVTNQQTIEADFYIGVKAYERRDHKRFLQAMKKCASGKDWETISEFYLARFELQQRQPEKKKKM
jgi:tetratricopeptide (TPR) repeat protein